MKLWMLAAILAAFSFSVQAQGLLRLRSSTPDIAVSSDATPTIRLTKNNRAGERWISIRNDCNSVLYFGLNTTAASATADSYPIRLDTGETFTGRFIMGPTLEASHGATKDAESTQCTFSLIYAD